MSGLVSDEAAHEAGKRSEWDAFGGVAGAFVDTFYDADKGDLDLSRDAPARGLFDLSGGLPTADDVTAGWAQAQDEADEQDRISGLMDMFQGQY